MHSVSLVTPVGQLVTERPGRSRVFERLGIDYCCGGRVPLGNACRRRGLDPDRVLRELLASDAVTTTEDRTDWAKASISALADQIETTHHEWLREALPRLYVLLEKVVRAHGKGNPRLLDLQGTFAVFRQELNDHMEKEERVLFPMCRELERAETRPTFHCGSIRNPIRVMTSEHEDAGEALAAMRELTDGFTPPADACNTYRALLHGLAELEQDMHRHVHKENNILFPKAVAYEASLSELISV